MASIYKSGDAWIVRWREGERQRSRSCPSAASARELRRDVEAAVAVGRRWEPATVRVAVDLDTLSRAYLQSIALRRAPRTVAAQASALDAWARWLKSRDGRRTWTVEDLSIQLLEEFVEHQLGTASERTGRPRELSTVREYVGAVERLWSWAFDRDEYAGTPRPRRLVVDLRRPPGERVVAPTWSQMGACVHQLEGRHRALGVVLYYTGLRVDQAMRLEWRDVDLDVGELEVRGELGKTPAERRGRVIPLSAHLVAELRTWDRPNAWLIAGSGTGSRFERFASSRPFAAAWSDAKVSPMVWRRRPHHAFRRGVQTGLLAAGAMYEAVEALVGHALEGAGSSYVDLSRLPMRAAVELIPKLAPPSE